MMSFFKNDTIVSRSLLEYGEWAQTEVDILLGLIGPGDTVLDIGAFIGTHTLAFAKRVGDGGEVYAVEPHPLFFEVLKRNIGQNVLTNVRLLNVALSDDVRQAQIQEIDVREASNFAGTSVLEEGFPSQAPARHHTIDVATLDQLAITRCQLIKIDAENMEINVLKGARQTLRATRPVVFTECNSLQFGWPVVEFMGEQDYRTYLLNVPAYSPQNFHKNSTNFFGGGQEGGLILIPAERCSALQETLNRLRHHQLLIPISCLDDLALGLLKRPQYKYEVMLKGQAADVPGVGFWANQSEVEQIRRELGALQAEAERLRADRDRLAQEGAQLHAALTQRDAEISRITADRARLAQEIAAQHAALTQRDAETRRLDADLSRIYHSHGWKVLSAYYSLRNKLLPEGSRRLHLTKRMLRVIRELGRGVPKQAHVSPAAPAPPAARDVSNNEQEIRVPLTDKEHTDVSVVLALGETPAPWFATYPKLSEGDTQAIIRQARSLQKQPLFYVVLPIVGNVPPHFLRSAIESVKHQIYEKWQLCLVVDAISDGSIDILRSAFSEDDPRVLVVESGNTSDVLAPLQRPLENVDGEFAVLLNPFDEIKPEALHTIATEIEGNPSVDILYSKENMAGDTIWSLEELATSNLLETGFDRGLAFGQLVAWRRASFSSLVPMLMTITNTAQGYRHLRKLIGEESAGRLCRRIDRSLYHRRSIPGSRSLLLDGDVLDHLEMVVVSTPLRVVIDARLLDRQTSGSERYTAELLRALSTRCQVDDLKIAALVQSRPTMNLPDVRFVQENYREEIQHSHIFHKTFQPAGVESLLEMADAPVCVLTPLDLILFSYSDYFPSEDAFYRYREALKAGSQLADGVLAISSHGKQEVEQRLMVSGERVAKAYLGIRPDFFPAGGGNSAEILRDPGIPDRYFLYVGTNYPHKNLLTLLRALKEFAGEVAAAKLVIVGIRYYSKPQPEIDGLMEDLKDLVIDLGHVPDESLPFLYQKARALVYPSLYEGFDLPILEAMACGTPVIASRATSIPEVTGEEAAILVDATDEKQIVAAMRAVWYDGAVRERLIRAGFQQVAKFSWDSTAAATLHCYRRALEHVLAESASERRSRRLGVLEQFRTPSSIILMVTHVRFYPPAAGNELRIFNLINFLKKRGHQIAVIVNPLSEHTPLDHERLRSIHEYVDYYEEIGDFDNDHVLTHGYGQPLTTEPALERWRQQEQAFCPDAVLWRTSEFIKRFSPQVIIAEYIWTSRVLKLAPASTFRVIDLIDMFSNKGMNVNRFGFDDPLATSPDEERAFLNRADLAIAIQDTEAEAFRQLKPTCRVITAGIDFDVARLSDSSDQTSSPPVVLIVASNNPFNVRCVQEFSAEAWPIIRTQQPEAVLRIVGKVCHSLVNLGQGVELIPYAGDLTAAYRQATVVVNPVYAGTGLKVKSVETLGHGQALVSWPEGVAGIPTCADTPYMVSNSWSEMAMQVTQILTDANLSRKLRASARAFALAHLSAEVVYRELDAHFSAANVPHPERTLLQKPRREGLR